MSTRDGFEPRRACSREKGVNKSSDSASIPVLENRIHGAAQNRRDSTQSEIRIRGAPSFSPYRLRIAFSLSPSRLSFPSGPRANFPSPPRHSPPPPLPAFPFPH